MTELKVYLLTHEREIDRKTSTSNVVREVLKNASKTLIWKRKEPDSLFEDVLSPSNTVLVYQGNFQGKEDYFEEDLGDIEHFIFLEGTWQEARKIYNKSPYLKNYKLLNLKPSAPSQYTLRRNQVESGLSTVEAVAEVLKLKGEDDLAKSLYHQFMAFQLP